MPRTSQTTRHPVIKPTSPPMFVPTTPSVSQPPSFTQTMKEGFAFGTGTAIARNIVDRVMAPNPSSTQPTPQPTTQPTTQPPKVSPTCETLYNEFDRCVRERIPEESCQASLERLNQCLKEQK